MRRHDHCIGGNTHAPRAGKRKGRCSLADGKHVAGGAGDVEAAGANIVVADLARDEAIVGTLFGAFHNTGIAPEFYGR